MAFSFGISYEDYISMNGLELSEAVAGAMAREDRWMRMLRIIAYAGAGGAGMLKPGTKIVDFYPIASDKRRGSKSRADRVKARERMEAVFNKWDSGG